MSRDALHQALQQRVYGSVSADLLFKRARGSKYLIQCLQRSGTLTGHQGCVNTIEWSDSGDLLLSGSDDCKLNIYRPYQQKLLQSIHTGHRANIFSAKFLPCTADKWIVSCAGDGMIQFTDLEKPETHGKCSYNCHSGTAYEIITTPGDPNTFISCGEDGTVRMFDIRTKSQCTTRDCKEDVLIDCGKAVTSLGLNPLTPYQLGIGCEDSTVALFDRRSLNTSNSSHGMQGMLCKFKPDALKDRTCRVTSLQYSSDGRELLVSYCADYIYLFNTRGEKEVRISSEASGHVNGTFSNHDEKRSLPLKRLRLRGDWSDTGPNARPESEAASTESTLMQRMSDLFVRWIEESFRGNQRNRLGTSSQTRSDSSSSSTSSPSLPPRTSNESSGTSIQEATDMPIDESHVRVFETSTSGTSKIVGTENIDHIVAGTSGVKIEITNTAKSIAKTRQGVAETRGEVSKGVAETRGEVSKGVAETRGEVSPGVAEARGKISPAVAETRGEISPAVAETRGKVPEGVTETRGKISPAVAETRGEISPGVAETRGEISQAVAETRGEISPGVAETRGKVPEGVTETRGEISPAVAETDSKLSQGVAETRGEVLEGVDETRGKVPQGEARTPGDLPHGVAKTRGVVSPSAVTDEPIQESSEHNFAATRIQRVFRNYRLIKNFERSYGGESSEEKEIWIPKMTRVYRGHRNARTMIKEARFWGDRFIISGSDCGRIFIWNKDTTEIEMVLHGDRHVVNCVQPHPFDPIFASSGIDYDIKLWAPTADTPLHIDGLDEIIQRNEQMLEESRDTITVPASFMLRMLASLNHARFAPNQDDSDTDSTDDA